MKILLTLLVLLGTAGVAEAATVYPEMYGADPYDAYPDNEAINAAIVAAGAVGGDVVITECFDVESRSPYTYLGNPYRQFGLVVTANAKPVTIRAESGGCLRASGNWGSGAQALLAVFRNGARVTIRDLYIDMSGRLGGDEQQHAVQLDKGSKGIDLEGVTIYHPSLGVSAGGDCLRLVGGDIQSDVVEDVTVRRLVGMACDRSLIGFQRSVHGVTVDHVTSFYAGFDNDIDMEATGVNVNDELTWIQDVTIRSALIMKNGGNGITLGRGYRLRVLDSSVIGGAVFAVSCRDCVIANSTFMQAPGSVDPPISVLRASDRTKILNNRIGRLPGSTWTYPLVYIAANNDGAPRDTLVQGNDFAMSYAAPGLRADNADVTAIGNTFRYTGTSPANSNAIAMVVDSFTPGKPASAIVTANRFLGPWFAAVRVSGKVATSSPSGPVVVTGNIFDGVTRALRCEGLVPNLVRGLNYKSSTSLDECPLATVGY